MASASERSIEEYYKVCMSYVIKAGEIFRKGYHRTDVDYEVKADFFDLVTEYDRQIEDFLVSGLKEKFPESKFIGEEDSAKTKTEAELTDDPTWIIDPIDGTTNYIRNIPHCCISIALSIKKELVVGIIYSPILNELYSAWKGHGAYLNGEKITVSNKKTINQAVIAYEISLIHKAAVKDKNVKRIAKLASNATATRCFGTAALTLCYIAKGVVDSYHVEDLQPWDIAAGAVILREAGGCLVKSDGTEFEIMKPDLTAASTPELLENVMKLIQQANAITAYTIE